MTTGRINQVANPLRRRPRTGRRSQPIGDDARPPAGGRSFRSVPFRSFARSRRAQTLSVRRVGSDVRPTDPHPIHRIRKHSTVPRSRRTDEAGTARTHTCDCKRRRGCTGRRKRPLLASRPSEGSGRERGGGHEVTNVGSPSCRVPTMRYNPPNMPSASCGAPIILGFHERSVYPIALAVSRT